MKIRGMKIIGLIPARKDSKRLPGKNMALLNGKPLLEYAIISAIESAVFDKIVVTTNLSVSELKTMQNSRYANIYILRRPDELCTDEAHDYLWVSHAFKHYPRFDAFAILRPTNPFRTAETIRKALFVFKSGCDSVRAVEPTKHHPGKSWFIFQDKIYPFKCQSAHGINTYDKPTQSLENVYCQNACIHIAKTEVLSKYQNVTGKDIKPYFTTGDEGVDINTPDDLYYADWIMRGRP